MGTVRLGVFPSINNKIMQDNIADQVCKWFIGRFPVGFFNHIYIDTQNKNASQYIINPNGEFIKYESGQKITMPNIRFTIEQGQNNIKDTFNGIYNVNMKPGAFAIDTDLTGYKPIYEDCYGSVIATNEYPIRNNISIRISVNTKSDQLAIANILNSNFKAGTYGDIIICDSVVPLPELLMEYIRSCLFKPEIINLSKMNPEDTDYTEYKQKINRKFTEFIYRFSNAAIKPYKTSTKSNSNKFIYGYERKQRVFLRLEDPELDSGSKKGNVYEKFNIELSGTIDYANLITFITSVPAIIRGTKNNWYMATSEKTDRNLYYSMMKFKEVYRENRILEPVSDKYIHFYLERELLMSSGEENFNIIDEIITEKQFPAHYYILKALLSLIKTQKEFDELFKVCIYKDKFLINDYEIDWKFNIKVHKCDLSIPYYIDIFLNKEVYKIYLEKIKDMLDKYEIDWNESNIHTNRGYVTNLLTGIYRGRVIKSHNDIQLDPNYIGRDISYQITTENIFKGSVWNVSEFGDGENIYIPIKPELYLICDPDYKYYLKETEHHRYDKPELVKDGKISRFINNNTYFYYNHYGDFKEVEKSKLVETKIKKLISYNITKDKYPKKKDYYVKDRETGRFEKVSDYSTTIHFDENIAYFYKDSEKNVKKVEKIRVFDKKMQYFAVKDGRFLELVNLKAFDEETEYFYKSGDDYISVPYVYVYNPDITYYTKDDLTDSYVKVNTVKIFNPDIDYYERFTEYDFDENCKYYYYKRTKLYEYTVDSKVNIEKIKFYIYKENNPEPDTVYYHYENSYNKDKYIFVENMKRGFNINKDYYIKDKESGEFIKIDVYRMVVPNPYFKYYIQDNDNNFRLIKNLSEFQKDIQYYVCTNDFSVGNITVNVNE